MNLVLFTGFDTIDLIQFFEHLVVAYFLGHPVY